MEIELAYNIVTVLYVNHYTLEIPLKMGNV